MNYFTNYITVDDYKVNNELCTKVKGKLNNSGMKIFILSLPGHKNEMAKATANKHVAQYLALPLRQDYIDQTVDTANNNIRQSLIKL